MSFRLYIIIGLFLLATGNTGCQSETNEFQVPAGMISQDTMAAMLLDMHLLESASNLNKLPISNKYHAQIYPFVFKKYGVTQERFDTSFAYYRSQPALMDTVYQQIINEASRMQSEEGLK
ncbi:MAG: DUF4296 domain-containing protein [Flavobacteriales bacterium]|nr:DUF4296 domain-containing protein [Flavobacteriales bacterium]